ncbi:RhoGAP domain protein [Oesophagostomum dentatum]|uniref:RhoGAP domain protein n=1 Tax=Oesophagostomum dentatum TaxID=61180 RepID=A0A0B1T338_OESDE|nr:RhoGAP domain protein [Oesophagostomum dentatum]
MVEELEKEKKRKGLRLVSRKSTKKMLGKWKKLDEAGDKSDKEYMAGENEPLRQVLGVQLETAIEVDPSLDGVPLPAFFRHAIDYVETHGLTLEGIYRVSSPKSRLDELEKKANDGSPLNFVEGHEAAGLIKRFLRQLPEPLLSSDFENLVKNCTCDWRGVCQCPVRSQLWGSAVFYMGSRRSVNIEVPYVLKDPHVGRATGSFVPQQDYSNPTPGNTIVADASSDPTLGGERKPSVEAFNEARKYTKYALSAIDYEDTRAVVENLRKALSLMENF